MNRLTKKIILFAMLLVSLTAFGQVPQKPLFLKSLQLRFDSRVKFAQNRFQQQFVNRPFSPELLKNIRAKADEQLREQGYYFADFSEVSTDIDSALQSVDLTISVKTNGVLRLDSLRITNRDSLPETLLGDVDDALAVYPGKIYTGSLSQSMLRNVTTIFENHGFPLARIQTQSFDFRELPNENEYRLDLSLHISPGDSVRIAYIKFPKQKNDITGYLQRLLRFQPDKLFDAQRVDRYSETLRRQDFLKNVRRPELLLDKKGNYFLSIDFEETPSTTFDGIVGYIPPPATDPAASGYFTGLVNVGIRNLFGGGRKIHVFWQKQDRFSDEFRVGYREPFVAGLPFHFEAGMHRLVRDTTYIEWQYLGRLELPLSDALSAFVDLSSRNVSPDSLASRVLRLPRTESVITETGIRWDARDDFRNPRRGVFLEIAFGISRQSNIGPDYLLAEDSLKTSVSLQKMRADLGVFLPTFRNQLIANNFHANFIESNGEVLRLTDQVWFGGATTIRGFREAQFFAKRVFWLNSEYRFLLGPDTRLFVFTDNGYFERESPDNLQKWLTSYGMGLRLTAPLGVMQIDFGLERGAPFREGKLHIRLINDF
ncbi:MAG: BamA/TamA family outer membrane protein [Calditrichaeota bacterium]|nr:BamA/TamA family outer membrane protein [Calditrichota bacterium]